MTFTVSIANSEGTTTVKVPDGYNVQPIDFFVDLCHEAEKGSVLTLFKDGIAISDHTAF